MIAPSVVTHGDNTERGSLAQAHYQLERSILVTFLFSICLLVIFVTIATVKSYKYKTLTLGLLF